MEIKQILMSDPEYQQERRLRNEILLRPIGLQDGAWEMHDSKSKHYVAIENDKVIGCVILTLDNPKSGTLRQMAVDSDHQSKGIGRKLVEKLIEDAKNDSLELITCHAQVTAMNFYRKINFTIVGEEFMEVNIPHIEMEFRI